MNKIIFARICFLLILLFFYQSCSRDASLEWQKANGYRWAALDVPHSGKTGFQQLYAEKMGITFSNSLTKEQILENRILLNGSGVAVGDVDGDGLVDLYFCRLNGPNVLYKNLGNWRFQDITDSAGVACPDQFSTGAVLADLDGDADLDLLVTANGGPNACFLNDGTGTFTEAPQAAGMASTTGASTMALADIDGDGDLDLYMANYKKKSAKDLWDPGELVFSNVVERVGDSARIAPKYREHFVIDIRGEWILYLETGEPDMLFLNDGTGHFENISAARDRFLDENGEPAGLLKDWGLMVRFQDIDEDGDPDIYVCNDFESPDRIWLNDGTGHFRAIPKFAIRHTSNSSMAVDFSDIDRDGDLDYLVMDMLSLRHHRRMTQRNTSVPLPHPVGQIDKRPQYMRNTLFLNRGDKTYAEIAQFSGIAASEWSWSNLFLDVDLDGYEDVLVATGHYYDAQDFDAMQEADSRIKFSAMAIRLSSKIPDERNRLNTILLYPKLALPNIAFRNRGDLRFEEVGKKWGLATVDISHGMALGDLDNDGDLDVVMNRLNMPVAVFRNEASAPRVAVRLRGLPPNTQGIGAKIRVRGGPVPQSKEVISGGTYLSSSDPMSVFAAGDARELTIEVTWRNGKTSTISGVKPNTIIEIDEAAARPGNTKPIPEAPSPIFEDVSRLISHKHFEDPFDDFQRQPLLPNRLSRSGPGVAWVDFDADGDDDLMITSGKGGSFAWYRNDGKAGFHAVPNRGGVLTARFEQATALGWTGEDGTPTLLVGNSNLQEKTPASSFVQRFILSNGLPKAMRSIDLNSSSIGPMAMADYDLDGDLDLFVGGRSIPARYPQPASSTLLRNENGTFKVDALNSARFKALGLVSGAVFSDIDGDGDPDLVLAVEWGPVTVFRNQNGRFSDATDELGFASYHGWWQGVTTGDLDEDGKLDIIATNWGLNNIYQNLYDSTHPLQIFSGDFDNNGYFDIVEAYYDRESEMLVPVRNRMAMMHGIPTVRMRIPDNKKYGRSGIQAIIGPRLKTAARMKASTLAHTVFLNRGDHYEAVEMPLDAQFSPAFYAGVADFDGDGHDDVFINQNFFASHAEIPRADAGRGLWLKGDGTGGLKPVPGQVSGIKVYGEQRGAALGDYDRDGRVDLVVSQNGAETRLYHNVGARPGLRVRLAGPKGNRHGAGASVRLMYENKSGPAREIHLGSGYWSQNSMMQVMGKQKSVKGLWVRWPGGKVTETALPAGATEVTVTHEGELILER